MNKVGAGSEGVDSEVDLAYAAHRLPTLLRESDIFSRSSTAAPANFFFLKGAFFGIIYDP